MRLGQQLLQLAVLGLKALHFFASDTRSPRTSPATGTNVCSLIPCCRQRACFLAPASASFRIPMICSSLNRRLSESSLVFVPENSLSQWTALRGEGHRQDVSGLVREVILAESNSPNKTV